MRPKILNYYAAHDAALRNGSFYRKIKWGEDEVSFSEFVNGDFMGTRRKIPEGLREYSPQDAEQIVPQCCVRG